MDTKTVLKHYRTKEAAIAAIGIYRQVWEHWTKRGISKQGQLLYERATKGALKAQKIRNA
jgi:hypothetical protein